MRKEVLEERDARTRKFLAENDAKLRGRTRDYPGAQSRFAMFCKRCGKFYQDYREQGYAIRPKWCIWCNPNAKRLLTHREYQRERHREITAKKEAESPE